VTSVAGRLRTEGRIRSEGGGLVAAPLAATLVICGLAVVAGVAAGERGIVIVAALAALVAAVAVALKPDRATLVVVAVLYSNAAAIAVSRFGLPYIAGALLPLLLVVPFAYHVVIRRQPIIIASGLPYLLGYFIVLILSFLAGMSADPARATDAFGNFVGEGLLVYFALTNVVRSLPDLRNIVWVMLLVGGFLGALSVYQQVTGSFDNDFGGFAKISQAVIGQDEFGQGGDIRLAGPIGEKNRYAQILLVLIPLGLFRVWGERRLALKVIAGGATLFCALGIALTYSRGAALGFAIAIAFMALLGYIRPKQILALGLGAAILFTLQPAYLARLYSLEAITNVTGSDATAAEDGSISKRANETIAALLVFSDHPILGVGRGLFPVYYGNYSDEVGISSDAESKQAHNLYAGMLAEVGIIGFLLFMAIFIVTFIDLERVRRRWKVRRPEYADMATAFALSIVAYLASGMFLHLSYERYLWMLMALAASAAWIGMHATELEEEATTETPSNDASAPAPGRRRVRTAYLRQAQRP
jgi:O-antigen ligase